MKPISAACACSAIALSCLSNSALAQESPSWLRDTSIRVGYVHVAPRSSASDAVGAFLPGPPSGISLKVENQSSLFFSIAHALTPNLEAELALGYPPTHDVKAQLSPSLPPNVQGLNGQVIAKVRQIAPTLFFNYKFGDANSTWRPYVGAGINYTNFDKRDITSAGNALNGGPTYLSLSDSWGLAAQAGISYRLNEQWSLNAGIATARVKTTLTATTAGVDRKVSIRFRPAVLTLTAGYTF